MDLAITLAVILILILWPHRRSLRCLLLFIPAAGAMLLALLFAPRLLFSPLFYPALALLSVILIYTGLAADRKRQPAKR